MRFFIAVGLLAVMCSCALAEESKPDPVKALLAAGKQKLIAEIDTQIMILETAKICIETAHNDEAVQECRKTQKKALEDLEKRINDPAARRVINREDPNYKEMPKKSRPVRPNAPRAQPAAPVQPASK